MNESFNQRDELCRYLCSSSLKYINHLKQRENEKEILLFFSIDFFSDFIQKLEYR